MSDEESIVSFQDAESKQELIQLRNSARGYKGALTRRINVAESHIETAGSDPTSHVVADLLRSKDNIQRTLQCLEDAYTRLQEADPDSFQECEAVMDKEGKRTNEIVAKINKTLNKSTHPATPRVSDPPMALANPSTRDTPHATPNKALKPFILQYKSKPTILTVWSKQFRAYYSSSNFQYAKIDDQHAYFLQCLSPTLQTMLAKDLEADTQIFGEDGLNKSAMQMLEDIFLMTSPPLQRKLDLFRVGQNGRTFSTWSTELHNLADEAKLDTLTSDEILVLLYIIGADDGNLQDKFLTEYEPTLKTIERIGFQHEITSNSKQAVIQSKNHGSRNDQHEQRMQCNDIS